MPGWGQGSEIQSPVALMAIFWAVIESQTSAVGRRSISPYSTTLKWSKVWLPPGLILSSYGVLSGTLSPTLSAASFPVAVKVTASSTS